jgi:hypothetical protein
VRCQPLDIEHDEVQGLSLQEQVVDGIKHLLTAIIEYCYLYAAVTGLELGELLHHQRLIQRI